jgi:hypothetical protein
VTLRLGHYPATLPTPDWLSQRSAQQAPGDYCAARDKPGDHREAHGRDQTPPPEGEADEETSADKHREADQVQRHVRSHTKSLTDNHPDGDHGRR